jgi:dihydroflavonol-4-reductase
MPACLVLGATGFIGGHIARAVLERGWRTRGLRRDPRATGSLGEAPLEWVSGDLTDPDSLLAAMQGIEIVFHAAAYYPKRGQPLKDVPSQVAYPNQEIEMVLEAARQAKVRRFVFTSTLTTIGNPSPGNDRLADERDFYVPGTLPKNSYYETKFAMEARVLEAARKGFPAVVVNPTAVFGPGDVHGTMGNLLLAVARGWGIAWLPVTTNLVDVRDVALAHLAAAEKGAIGERYILGGHNMSLREALGTVARAAGVHPPRFEIPLRVVDWLIALGEIFPPLSTGSHLSAIRYWQGYNTEKAQRVLGLSARSFEQTIRDTLHSNANHGEDR